jgi:hypothetical protein
MKLLARLPLFLTTIFLLTFPVTAQKRSSKSVRSAPVAKPACRGGQVPIGLVVVGYKASERCTDGVELILKKPADNETVCDGSPVPEGFLVVRQTGTPACAEANPNPLTNALVIVRNGSAATSASPTSTVHRRATNDDDEDADARPGIRITVSRGGEAPEERPKSVVERRAEEEQRKALIQQAALNHKIVVGMTKDQVLESWGRPTRVAKSASPSGLSETWWYYPNGNTVWIDFAEGVVTNYHADY